MLGRRDIPGAPAPLDRQDPIGTKKPGRSLQPG